MPHSKTSVESPFKRPYASRRHRDAARRNIKSPANKLLLRLLAALVVLLVTTLVVIFKDVGKSTMATGAFMSADK